MMNDTISRYPFSLAGRARYQICNRAMPADHAPWAVIIPLRQGEATFEILMKSNCSLSGRLQHRAYDKMCELNQGPIPIY